MSKTMLASNFCFCDRHLNYILLVLRTYKALHITFQIDLPLSMWQNCKLYSEPANFSFHGLELTVGLGFVLHEVSSCPPFSYRLLTDKLRAFGKMLSSSRASSTALTACSTCQRNFLPSLPAVSEQRSMLRELFQSPSCWNFSACSCVSFSFD